MNTTLVDETDDRIIKLNPVEAKPEMAEEAMPVKKAKKPKKAKSEKQVAHLKRAREKRAKLKQRQTLIDTMKQKIFDNDIFDEQGLKGLFIEDDSKQLEMPGADPTPADTLPDDAPTEAPIGDGPLPEQPSNEQVYHEQEAVSTIETINPNDVYISISQSERPFVNWASSESWLDRF